MNNSDTDNINDINDITGINGTKLKDGNEMANGDRNNKNGGANKPKFDFIHSLAVFLVRYRAVLFYSFIAFALSGIMFIKNIKIDNSIELWFLDDDATFLAYNEFKDVYGNDEVIIAMVDSGGDDKIFNPGFLSKLRSFSLEAEENPDVRRVLGIGSAPYIGLQGEQDMIVEDLYETTDETAINAAEVKKRFGENKLWPKLLADKKLRHTVIIIEPAASKEMDTKRPEMIAFIKEKLDKYGFNYKMAGMGVMYDELNRLSLRDSGTFTLLSYAILLATLYLLFRSRYLVLITFVVMLLSGLAFLNVYGFFHQSFNMVTIVLPTLIMILCIADVNHIFNRYYMHLKDVAEDKEKGLVMVIKDILYPSLFTSLTECIGFASIILTPIAVLRTFGAFAAYSAMAEYIIVWATVPYMLGLIKPTTALKLERPFEKQSKKILDFVILRRKPIFLIFLAAIALSFYGVKQLDVDTYSMGFLQPSNPVRMDSDFIESVYGNYLPLEVRFKAKGEDAILEPDFLNRLVNSQKEIESFPDTSKCASITDVIMRLNQIWTDGKEESYRIPDNKLQVKQLIMLYESDPDNDLVYMTDKKFTEARLTIRIPMISATNMKKIKDKVNAVLSKNFENTSFEVQFGGYVPLYVELLEYITWSQALSFGTALLYIFFVIGLLFMRFSALLWGLGPNVVPVIMTLGFMGIFDIRLDIATVTIASITLGIAVDDTIHELFHYYIFLGRGFTPIEAIRECLSDEGPAVMVTSLILCLGFSVLGLASIKSVMYFGLLIALTMIFAFLGELFLLPSMVGYLSDTFNIDKKLSRTETAAEKKD